MRSLAVQLSRWTIMLAIVAIAGEATCQQGPWYEGFEGPQATWEPAGGNAEHRMDVHQRIRGETHTGEGCERIRFTAGNGSEIFFAHAIGRPRVIDELLITAWFKADRPGAQIAAQVVLPRSRDPRTGRPITTVLHGSTYTLAGQWQQLRVENVPRLLTRQTWVLRSQMGPSVDPREAYVERILLNVYGGPGATDVRVDDLDVTGHVPVSDDEVARLGIETEPRAATLPTLPSESRPQGQSPQGPAAPRSRVQLSGSILLLDERPFFVRMIQYQGEPLGLLKQLGFNAVWLSRQPTAEMLDEARRLGLWLVCPPPPISPASPDGAGPPGLEVPPGYDCVLSWDLGSGLGGEQLDEVVRRAEQIRNADRRSPGRPLLCRPASELHNYSRTADLLILGRSPLGTSLELNDYGTWLRQQPRFLRHGTPFWTAIATQPPTPLRQQWAALAPGETPPGFSSEQIRLLVYTAITAGSRGLLFESFSPLTAPDLDTRTRALTLELLNLELDLAEPWAAAGHVVATVPGSESGTVATAIQCEHGRLLVPIWSPPRGQLCPGQAAANRVTFVVPGVPETNNAFLIAPGRLTRLIRQRKAGGLRVTLDEFDMTSLVLLTENPLIVTGLTRRTAQTGRRAAELERELAAAKLRAITQTAGRLSASALGSRANEWLATANKNLGQCDAYLAAKDDTAASLYAQRAMRPLRLLERAHWDATVGSLRSPMTSPAAVSFATLPFHAALLQRVAASQPSANQLPGGDFEEIAAVFEGGWRHFQHPLAGIETGAELSASAAHAGRFGLRMFARPDRPEDAPLLVESPPLWITSPPIAVEAHQLIRIQGWVHVPEAITGTVDGLMVVDSLGGEPLAERVPRTAGWEQFMLYRIAPQSGPMTLTFALSGFGEARIDDVTIQVLQPTGSLPR